MVFLKKKVLFFKSKKWRLHVTLTSRAKKWKKESCETENQVLAKMLEFRKNVRNDENVNLKYFFNITKN